MDLSPQHLRDVVFKEQWRGYNPDEVDDFLERVASSMEVLQERTRELSERAARAEQRASEGAEADEALRRTLVLAQRTADAATKEAHEDAARTMAEAEARAADLVEEAERRAAETSAEAQGRLRDDVAALEEARARLQADVDALRAHHDRSRETLRDLLRTHLRRLDEDDAGLEAPPELHDVELPPEPDRYDDAAGVEPEEAAGVEVGDGAALEEDDAEEDDADEGDDTQAVSLTDMEDHEDDDDDPFFAELRKAVDDDEPLGPSGEEVVVGQARGARSGNVLADMPEPPRARRSLRRRR